MLTASRQGLLQLTLLILGVVASVATSPAPPTLFCHIKQSTVAPPPTPSLRPPRRRPGYFEAGVGSTVTTAAKGTGSLGHRRANLYLSRGQIHGHLVFSWHRHFSVGASWELSVEGHRATPVSAGPLGPTRGVSGGGGVHFAFHLVRTRRFVLDLSCDAWAYGQRTRLTHQSAQDTPYHREYLIWWNAGSCALPDTTPRHEDREVRVIFIGRAQLTTGVALTDTVQLVAGLGVRNMPYYVTDRDSWHRWHSGGGKSDVDAHLIAPYLLLGVDVALSRSISLAVGAYQVLMGAPIAFAPVLGMNLNVVHWDAKWPTGEPAP